MHLNRETSQSNVIHAWESGRVRIGEEWLTGNVIVAPNDIVRDWSVRSADTLTLHELAPAIAFSPEIILIGTGERHILPDTNLMAALATQSIGLEIMTTPAACRTYNVLIHESRRVVAALLNHPSTTR